MSNVPEDHREELLRALERTAAEGSMTIDDLVTEVENAVVAKTISVDDGRKLIAVLSRLTGHVPAGEKLDTPVTQEAVHGFRRMIRHLIDPGHQ